MSKKDLETRLESIFSDALIPNGDSGENGQSTKPNVQRDNSNISLTIAYPTPSDTQEAETQENLGSYCSYIGLLDDPQTALSYPSEWNVCHRASPAYTPNLEHQRMYCLMALYKSCPFHRKNLHSALPAYIRG